MLAITTTSVDTVTELLSTASPSALMYSLPVKLGSSSLRSAEPIRRHDCAARLQPPRRPAAHGCQRAEVPHKEYPTVTGLRTSVARYGCEVLHSVRRQICPAHIGSAHVAGDCSGAQACSSKRASTRESHKLSHLAFVDPVRLKSILFRLRPYFFSES